MSGTKAILDSNAIINASKGKVDVEKLLLENDRFFASIITFIEVYAYDFANSFEKEVIDGIFENLEIIELNQEIADQAVIYRKNKSKTIKLPDAVILASAKFINANLITDNLRDFQDVDSAVSVLNLDSFRV